MQHVNKGLLCIHGLVTGHFIKGTNNLPERMNGPLCIFEELLITVMESSALSRVPQNLYT